MPPTPSIAAMTPISPEGTSPFLGQHDDHDVVGGEEEVQQTAHSHGDPDVPLLPHAAQPLHHFRARGDPSQLLGPRGWGTRTNSSSTKRQACGEYVGTRTARPAHREQEPACRGTGQLAEGARAAFIATAVDSCSCDTILGQGRRFPPAANNALAPPIRRRPPSHLRHGGHGHHRAITRLATAMPCAASQQSMILLRFHRSTSAPAGSPATSCAAASTPSTNPTPLASR